MKMRKRELWFPPSMTFTEQGSRSEFGEAGVAPASEENSYPLPLSHMFKETMLCYKVLGNKVVLSLVPLSYGSREQPTNLREF